MGIDFTLGVDKNLTANSQINWKIYELVIIFSKNYNNKGSKYD